MRLVRFKLFPVSLHDCADTAFVPFEIVLHLFQSGILRAGSVLFKLQRLDMLHLPAESAVFFLESCLGFVNPSVQVRNLPFDNRNFFPGFFLFLLQGGQGLSGYRFFFVDPL